MKMLERCVGYRVAMLTNDDVNLLASVLRERSSGHRDSKERDREIKAANRLLRKLVG